VCIFELQQCISYSAPPKFEPPTYQEVVSDTEIRVTLHPASNENGDVTHYYVIVVNNDVAEGRQPSDFRLDEVIGVVTQKVTIE